MTHRNIAMFVGPDKAKVFVNLDLVTSITEGDYETEAWTTIRCGADTIPVTELIQDVVRKLIGKEV